MRKKVVFHSFKGGTGKSNVLANVSVALTLRGLRVGVIDLDLKGPGLHLIFNLSEDKMASNVNKFLTRGCSMRDCTIDLTESLGIKLGRLYFIPASLKTEDIMRVFKHGYEIDPLIDAINELVESLNLDFLLVDTHPGLDEDTLISLVACDSVVILSRTDKQDYAGTAVTLEVLKMIRYDVLKKKIFLVVNQVPEEYDPMDVQAEFEHHYGRPVVGVIPFYREVLSLRSSDVFYLKKPTHPFSTAVREITESLLNNL